jgi:subtilisin family serine protease
MIITANKYVNARLGKPFRDAPNPFYLQPGDQTEIKCRVLGEKIEGNSDWFISKQNEFFWANGFSENYGISEIPYYTDDSITPKIYKDFHLNLLLEYVQGENISIGIIDSGVNPHKSISANIIDLNSSIPKESGKINHATTMACIIGGNDFVSGVVGVCPSVESIYSYTLTSPMNATPEDVICGLNLMESNNVKVINMSFAFLTERFRNSESGRKLQEKISALVSKGFIIIAATGNNWGATDFFYPAGYRDVISVAGFNYNLKQDGNANFWDGVSVCMCSEYYYNQKLFPLACKTSSASAIIAGCIACVFSKLKSDNLFETLNQMFQKFPRVNYTYENTYSIPRFDTTLFINSIKNSL